MKHALLCLCLFAGPLWGQEVQLDLVGDVTKIQVDKIIVVKEDLRVVNKLPFVIRAPAGGFLYAWDFPQGVTATKKARELTVTKAPNGRLTISVEYVVINFKAESAETKTGSIDFSIGAPLPPEPPIPPKPPDPPAPEPTDAIWPALKAAWQADPSATKIQDKDNLASLYAQSGAKTAFDPTLTKVIALKNIIRDARITLMGDRLPTVRQVINDESQRVLPSAVDANLDLLTRELCGRTFTRFAELLKRLP